jgi:hypothetical protein
VGIRKAWAAIKKVLEPPYVDPIVRHRVRIYGIGMRRCTVCRQEILEHEVEQACPEILRQQERWPS